MPKPISPIINWNNPITRGLIAAYPFAERSTALARDIVGVNNGTSTSITLTRDILGSAYQFDGSASIVATSSLWITASASLSMVVIFKSDDYTQTRQTIITNGVGTGGSGRGIALVLSGNGTTDGSLMLLDHVIKWVDTGYKLQNNNLHMAVVVLNGAGNPRVYLDGILIYSSDSTTFSSPNGSSYIGSSNIASDRFKGLIHGALIYKRALSQQEVTRLYVNPWQVYRSALPRPLNSGVYI